MKERKGERENERVTGRRERVQLKLAQFSHSPVIRMPGIYIIKSRKFLSSLYRFCMRALTQCLPVPSRSRPLSAISRFPRYASRARFFFFFLARPNVASLPRDYRRQQGSNPRFRSELRLIALIAGTSRLYYSLFNHALRTRRHLTF